MLPLRVGPRDSLVVRMPTADAAAARDAADQLRAALPGTRLVVVAGDVQVVVERRRRRRRPRMLP